MLLCMGIVVGGHKRHKSAVFMYASVLIVTCPMCVYSLAKGLRNSVCWHAFFVWLVIQMKGLHVHM